MKSSPNKNVIAWLDEQPAATTFIIAITRAEIELGIALLPAERRRESVRSAARRVFEEFSRRSLVFGEMSAVRYGQLVADRTRLGCPISVEDAQIASTEIGR